MSSLHNFWSTKLERKLGDDNYILSADSFAHLPLENSRHIAPTSVTWESCLAKPSLFTSSFLRLQVSCPLPSGTLTGHFVTQILPPLPKRGVSHHVDNVASQAAQDAVNSGEGAAGAGQRVPHFLVVEARGFCSREPRMAWGPCGQGYRKGENRTALTFINYKMPGALLCSLHTLYYFIYSDKNP